jgi:heme-degrading monooxygenase HmoA
VAHHLAQLNIAVARAPMDDALMAAFAAALDEVNAIADQSPGFVWRLQDDDGNATAIRPYEDERVMVNMSVWESVEALRAFVYGRNRHKHFLQRRREWFEHMEEAYVVLWWVPAGHIPSVEEAKERLEHLREHGPTPEAFTFRQSFEAVPV